MKPALARPAEFSKYCAPRSPWMTDSKYVGLVITEADKQPVANLTELDQRIEKLKNIGANKIDLRFVGPDGRQRVQGLYALDITRELQVLPSSR
jgi:hypothetical protein